MRVETRLLMLRSFCQFLRKIDDRKRERREKCGMISTWTQTKHGCLYLALFGDVLRKGLEFRLVRLSNNKGYNMSRFSSFYHLN